MELNEGRITLKHCTSTRAHTDLLQNDVIFIVSAFNLHFDLRLIKQIFDDKKNTTTFALRRRSTHTTPATREKSIHTLEMIESTISDQTMEVSIRIDLVNMNFKQLFVH